MASSKFGYLAMQCVCGTLHNVPPMPTGGFYSCSVCGTVLTVPPSGNTASPSPGLYTAKPLGPPPFLTPGFGLQNPSLPVVDQDMPLVGFRAWATEIEYEHNRLSPFSPVRRKPARVALASAAVSGWKWIVTEENVATCAGKMLMTARGGGHNAIHPAPHFDCSCGLYAYKSLYMAEPYFNANCVRGAVLIYGKVFEHRDGFRAERARVLCLVESDLAMQVNLETGIPIVSESGLMTYVKEFGKVLD